MKYLQFLRWLCEIVLELFPYGLILALTLLSIDFFVYAPFSFTALSLSSGSVILSLVLIAYRYFGPKRSEDSE